MLLLVLLGEHGTEELAGVEGVDGGSVEGEVSKWCSVLLVVGEIAAVSVVVVGRAEKEDAAAARAVRLDKFARG